MDLIISAGQATINGGDIESPSSLGNEAKTIIHKEINFVISTPEIPSTRLAGVEGYAVFLPPLL